MATPSCRKPRPAPLDAKHRRDSGLEVFYESQILMNRSFRVAFPVAIAFTTSKISARVRFDVINKSLIARVEILFAIELNATRIDYSRDTTDIAAKPVLDLVGCIYRSEN